MNPEVKQLWLDALRSGEYKQGRNVLRDKNDNYCCLGVLTDLYVKNVPDAGCWVPDDDNNGRYKFNNNITYLPNDVADWSGVVCVDPIIKDENGNTQSLALLNDSGYSFNAIANIIETQY